MCTRLSRIEWASLQLQSQNNKIKFKSYCFSYYSVGSLGCGYPSSSLVCCPRGSSYSNTWYTPRYPVPGALGNKDDNQCGRSVVQGENYNGIGAYPWVVRVAFRSEYLYILYENVLELIILQYFYIFYIIRSIGTL